MSIEMNYINWNTTFPVFTFCYDNKLNETAMNDFIQNYPQPSDSKKLELFLRSLSNITYENLESLENYPEIPSDQYIEILEKISYNFHLTITGIAGFNFNIIPTMTPFGRCFSFNSEIANQFSSVEKHFPKYEINFLDADAFLLIHNISRSGKTYYHGPFDEPNKYNYFEIVVNPKTFSILIFKPVDINTNLKIRQLWIYQRNCRYTDESELEYFPWIYTYSLCKTNCRIQKIMELCDCMPLFYKKRCEYGLIFYLIYFPIFSYFWNFTTRNNYKNTYKRLPNTLAN